MQDNQIVALYYARDERAIVESSDKYGVYCTSIAQNILQNLQDSEECVNDTWLSAWNSIPPAKPSVLKTYLGKITRNLALNRYKYYNRQKRGEGQTELVLDELLECVPAAESTEQAVEEKILVEVLNRFLDDLPEEKMKIFMRRYWYMSPIKEIADDFAMGESKVKMILSRSRSKLKQLLEKEGIIL